MAKLSLIDKMRVQTLREQGLGAKAIRSAYPKKNWSLSTLKSLCRRTDSRGSAVERKKGSGRPKTARTADNVKKVETLICSQEGKPGTHSSTHEIAAAKALVASQCATLLSRISASQSSKEFQDKFSMRPRSRSDLSAASSCCAAAQLLQQREYFLLMKKYFTWTLQ